MQFDRSPAEVWRRYERDRDYKRSIGLVRPCAPQRRPSTLADSGRGCACSRSIR
ncbi:MAG: hypothetical protein ACLR4Z_04305 [Butyricicoccaceae bacterium]